MSWSLSVKPPPSAARPGRSQSFVIFGQGRQILAVGGAASATAQQLHGVLLGVTGVFDPFVHALAGTLRRVNPFDQRARPRQKVAVGIGEVAQDL